MKRVAVLCGFLSVIVYPAIPLGHSSGIPLIDLVGVIALGVLVRRHGKPNSVAAFALLLLPLWVSSLAATLGGWAVDPSIAAKTIIALALAMSCLAIPELLSDPAAFLRFLDGLSLGVLVHVAFGVIQLGDFSRGTLSFLWLYETNPGLPFSGAIAADYVHFIQRPWGLFPEPSAMSASLGPLLLVLMDVGLSRAPGWIRRVLYVASAAGGVWLVVASRSGFSVFVTAATGVLLAARLFRGRTRRTSLLALGGMIPVAVAGVLLVGLAISVLGDRTELSQNGSWLIRWASLGASLSILTTTPATLLLGTGAGQSFLFLQQSGVAEGTGITAIWSVLLTYLCETGAIGMLAMGLLFARCFRSLRRSTRPFAGWLMWGVWIAAVGFTTSYSTLPAPWLALGLLLAWDRIFSRAPVLACHGAPLDGTTFDPRLFASPLAQGTPPAASWPMPSNSCR